MRTVFLMVAMSLPLVACGGSPPDSSSTGAVPLKSGAFVVPAAQLAHLKVEPVKKTSWTTTVHATGTVDWDNDHTTQAITQVGGRVTRIVVDTGVNVKEGDPLLYVASPDLTSAVSDYRKAKNRMDLAQRTLDRSTDLFAHQAIAQRELESVQADYNDAATDVQNALQGLRIFEITQDDLDAADRENAPIPADLAMRAPISGTVIQKSVLPGQVIQAGATVAFVISNTSTVWVQGHIYEKDLAVVHVGDLAESRNSMWPQTFHGVVAYVDRFVDPTTRTVLARIVTPNTDGLLKKDIFLDIVIHDRAPREVLAVPVAAVLYDDQNLPFVYVEVEKGTFAQRSVQIGSQQGDALEVVDGLTTADRVVSEGSLFLQSANSVGR